MKQFIAFVRKEFHHILRDRRTMLILIGMPIVQIILFGFAISTEVRNVQTAILTPSLQTDVRKVMEQLDASEYFTVKYVVQSPDEIERLFRRNLIELAVVFPSDLHRLRFDSEEIQILADATDPNLAVTRSTYAQTILRQALQTIRQATTTPAYSQPDKQPVMVYNKLLYNPQMKSAYNFVPGVMGLILMLICAMMTSISIVREKETGTMEVLLVSPVNPLFIILSKAVPYFVLSLLNLTTILLLSVSSLSWCTINCSITRR
jgi:ABC-2 type transport system permease protein